MQYVKYIGPATLRQITADEFRGVGVTDHETVRWEASNGFMVPASQFSDRVLEDFIRPDERFILVGQDDVPRRVQDGMTGVEAHAPKPALITDEARAAAAQRSATVRGGTGGAITPANVSTRLSGASKARSSGGTTTPTGGIGG